MKHVRLVIDQGNRFNEQIQSGLQTESIQSHYIDSFTNKSVTMGNKQSNPEVQEDVMRNDNESNNELSSSDSSSSGVFLSEALQADVVNSFQSSVLQQQWQSLQSDIIKRHYSREANENARKDQVEEELLKWRAQNNQIQTHLDDSIDSLNAKFNDLSVEMQFNTDKLLNTIVPNHDKKTQAKDACVDVRTALVTCYNQVQDIRKCDDVVATLEQCVKNTIIH